MLIMIKLSYTHEHLRIYKYIHDCNTFSRMCTQSVQQAADLSSGAPHPPEMHHAGCSTQAKRSNDLF